MSTTRRFSSSRWTASQSVATRESTLSILLLPDIVFASVGFGEPAGLVLVVFAQAALDHLVLQVVFEVLDPTPWPQVELPHEVVTAEGALQLLHGVLGPYLIYPALEAAPGLLGDAPPPRRAPRYVGPGELEEHVHVRELLLAARQVSVPDKAPDRRVAPRVPARGVPVGAHVVRDEVRDGVYVVLRVGEALHRPARYGGPDVLVAVEVDLLRERTPPAALAFPLFGAPLHVLRPAVGATVLVGERPRLPNVVEEGRLAQDGVGLHAPDHDQGVLEDVLVVELGLLLHVDRLHELGHHVRHEAETHQRPQARGYVIREEDLLELLPLALGGDARQPAGVVADRLLEVWRYGEGPLRPGKGRLEADGAQHP